VACAALTASDELIVVSFSTVMLSINALFFVVISTFWRLPRAMRLPGIVQLLSRACVGVVVLCSPIFLMAILRPQGEFASPLRGTILSWALQIVVCAAWVGSFVFIMLDVVLQRLLHPRQMLPDWLRHVGSTRREDAGLMNVFLSHDWGPPPHDNHKCVEKIHRKLREHGITSWLDDEQMAGGGDIVHKMTKGIDGASVVVVFITGNFMDKVNGDGAKGDCDSCKIEFEYAFRRKGLKKMLPVVLDPECLRTSEWHGPVGTLGGQLYVDLSGENEHSSHALDEVCCQDFESQDFVPHKSCLQGDLLSVPIESHHTSAREGDSETPL
jgi:hypothetical protein